MYKEFGDVGWTLRAVGYQTLVAYMVATIIYQGSQLMTAHFSLVGLTVAVLALGLMVYGLFVKRESQDLGVKVSA